MSKDKMIGGVVALIGIAMVAMHFEAGLTAAPVLSGVALFLLGGNHFMEG